MENGQTLKRPVEATCPGRGCERQKVLQLKTLLSEGDGLDRWCVLSKENLHLLFQATKKHTATSPSTSRQIHDASIPRYSSSAHSPTAATRHERDPHTPIAYR